MKVCQYDNMTVWQYDSLDTNARKTKRRTSWVKRRTRSWRSNNSRDVASTVKTPEALVRATSLESVLRRLLVIL